VFLGLLCVVFRLVNVGGGPWGRGTRGPWFEARNRRVVHGPTDLEVFLRRSQDRVRGFLPGNLGGRDDLGVVRRSGKKNGMSHDTLSGFVEATDTKFGIPGVAVGAWADGQEVYASGMSCAVFLGSGRCSGVGGL
jgi:hypothetical protein